MKINFYVTDAYGGFGGIAQFNRNFCEALLNADQNIDIEVMPLHISEEFTEPERLKVNKSFANKGRISFLSKSLKKNFQKTDITICGHINLLPACSLSYSPIVLIIHGVEVWKEQKWWIKKALKKVDLVISVSEYSANLFASINNFDKEKMRILPNAVDLGLYEDGEVNLPTEISQRIQNKKKLLTVSRLSAAEKYKGHDLVIKTLPKILEKYPDLVYIIAGDGDDQKRLESLVKDLDLIPYVLFTGRVSEEVKVDLYRASNCFVMPGRGEGFGIVYLEAMACGCPVIASKVDGSYEAVLKGKLGEAVDPDDEEAFIEAVFRTLDKGRVVPDGLEHFSINSFNERVSKIMKSIS